MSHSYAIGEDNGSGKESFNSFNSSRNDNDAKGEESEAENFEDFIDRNNDHEANIDKNWDVVHIVNKENQICEKNNASIDQDENKKVMVKCWYCNKSFEKGTIYEEHYDCCYDSYAYLHM